MKKKFLQIKNLKKILEKHPSLPAEGTVGAIIEMKEDLPINKQLIDEEK